MELSSTRHHQLLLAHFKSGQAWSTGFRQWAFSSRRRTGTRFLRPNGTRLVRRLDGLDHLGESKAATAVVKAIEDVLANGPCALVISAATREQ